MGISRLRVRGRLNLARPEAGVNLKASVISNADLSGAFKACFTAAVRALLPHSPCTCLHVRRWAARTIVQPFGKRRLQVKEQRAVQHFWPELFKVDVRDCCGSSSITSQTDSTSSWRTSAPDVSEHKLIHSCLSCHSFHYQFLFRPQVCFFFPPRICDNDCCRRSTTPVLFFLLKPEMPETSRQAGILLL